MSEPTRSRYLDYLPAIYQADPFLGQFLLPFQEVVTGFEELLSTIDYYFAPALAEKEFLPWLATWVALVLDEEWDEVKRRRLISEAVSLYHQRGTLGGLQRYLEIYTGLIPDIRECRWPGGMQIGVASQIGSVSSGLGAPATIESMTRAEPPLVYDYYVVDTVDGSGEPLQLYYRADRVTQVIVNENRVTIWFYPPGSSVPEPVNHYSAKVTRRDGLIDDHYTLTVDTDLSVDYHGDTVLVDEVELPYCFIVDVRVPASEVEQVKLDKVRAIVDLEKPAHTLYYLKLTSVVSQIALQPMQIAVRSTIGLDTIVG